MLQSRKEIIDHTGFAAQTGSGFVGQRLEFHLFFILKSYFFPVKNTYVFLLKLGGSLVESEARSIDFSDFSDSEPAGWTPLPHQLPKCLWGAGQKKCREALGEGEVPDHSDVWKS